MTPEEELARMEALRTGRGEMLPPIPPPGEVLGTGEGTTDLDAEIMAAAEEADAEEQAAAAAPPPLPPPTLAETRAALPPPIAIPQWEARRTGTPRGRTAHKVASGLLALLGGGNSYGRRVARENQQADEDYARGMRNYALQQQARKEQIGLLPVLPTILERAGLPTGMNRDEYQRYIQGGGAALERQRRQVAADEAELERKGEIRSDEMSAADKARREQIELRSKLKMQEIREAGKYKGKGGAAAPIVQAVSRDANAQLYANAAGITLEEAQEGLEDIDKGTPATDAGRAVIGGVVNNPKLLQGLRLRWQVAGRTQERDAEVSRGQLRKYYIDTADTRYGLKAWDQFAATNADKLEKYIALAAVRPYESWTKEQKETMGLLRAPIAAFLRKMAGAAMSPQEATLHGGQVAALLVDSSGQSWLSLEGIASRVESWVKQGRADLNGFMRLIDRIRGEVQEVIGTVLRGAPVAALGVVPKDDLEPILRERLMEGWNRRDEKLIANRPSDDATMKPHSAYVDGHRIRFEWVMPDGSTKPGSWSP